jgi:small subunit ribosomal protein S7
MTGENHPKDKPPKKEGAEARPTESRPKGGPGPLPVKTLQSNDGKAQEPAAQGPAAAAPEQKPANPDKADSVQEAPVKAGARGEAQPPKEGKKPSPVPGARILLFNRWEASGIIVNDVGLKKYVNLDPIVVPRTGGKYGPGRSQKDRMPIVERFMNRLMVSGHRGKKHKLTSGRHAGKVPMLYNTIKEAFVIIEKKTGKNPLQVLVAALENSALLEEVASYRLGGIIARNAVITSPQRRLDLALRHLTQGIYRSSFRSRQSLAGVIASELIAASSNDSKNFAISERNRIEREAEGAR